MGAYRLEIENPMVMADRGRIYHMPTTTTKRICDCGCFAKFRINGQLRCWTCAQDEGVELL